MEFFCQVPGVDCWTSFGFNGWSKTEIGFDKVSYMIKQFLL